MEKLQSLFSNYVLNVSITAWLTAQILKTLLYFLVNRKFNAERLFGAGGMPSAHSATVCGMTIALSRSVGFSSPLFAIAVVVASVVMYDAMGVRRQAGEHAKAINLILKQDREHNNNELMKQLMLKKAKYKEFLGHTPLEVLGGALLGIAIALLMPM